MYQRNKAQQNKADLPARQNSLFQKKKLKNTHMIQDLTRGDFFTYFEIVFRLSLSEARKIEIVWWIGLNRRKLGERTFFLKLIRPVKAELITHLCHSRLLLYYFIPPFPFLAQLSLFFFFGCTSDHFPFLL